MSISFLAGFGACSQSWGGGNNQDAYVQKDVFHTVHTIFFTKIMNNNNKLYDPSSVKKIAPGDCFGRLTVLERAGNRKGHRIYWLCSCSCGREKEVSTKNLRGYKGYEGTKSCGCLQKEAIVRQKGVPKKHGMSNSPEYNSWQQMKVRCLNPNGTSWARYGGRGITVCQEWIDSFEAFFDEVGLKPSPAHSIGRIEPDGNYEPGNVAWQTPIEQRNNRSQLTTRELVVARERAKRGRPKKQHEKRQGQWLWRGKWRDQ